MYARSSTFQAQPDTVDSAVAFCRDEVMPAMEQMAGCIGLSMMADRTSGRCIATSAWESLETMRASDAAMSRFRDRGAEIMGGTADVEEWEIGLVHRDHRSSDGACTRSSWIRVEPERVDRLMQVFRDVLPALESAQGFCSASVLLNRENGRCVATTTWDSRSAMERSRGTADQLRARVAELAGGRIADVAEFELALAHLRVPELV